MGVGECNNRRVANRNRQRQGLTYGPVRSSGTRDRGRILGNLLGLLVVAVTVGLLAFGIYLFLDNRNPSSQSGARPSASSAGQASAAASGSTPAQLGRYSLLPSIASGSPVVVSSGLPATPAPALSVPSVETGPGFITFGTTADAALHVTDPRTTFAADSQIVWSAYLTETANSVELRIRILKMDPTDPSGQRLVREDPVTPNVQGVRIFFRRVRLNSATTGPGLYTIEYLRGDEVLAQGQFLVLPG
jgi:hypothetical protein